MCPMVPGEIIDDYYFEFNEKENCDIMPISEEGYIKRERKQYLVNNNIIPLNFDVFKGDALVFDSLKSNKITLKSVNHDKVLTMDFTGFPYMGLWTKATGAPFVCIEPWYGHADFEDFEKQYLVNNNIIPLNFDVFNGDALVFDSLKSNKISLKSVNHNKALTMDFTGFPYMGLWTKATGAPFVCIEPWYGHADFEDFDGELKDKDGIEKLQIGQKFNSSYTVTI